MVWYHMQEGKEGSCLHGADATVVPFSPQPYAADLASLKRAPRARPACAAERQVYCPSHCDSATDLANLETESQAQLAPAAGQPCAACTAGPAPHSPV